MKVQETGILKRKLKDNDYWNNLSYIKLFYVSALKQGVRIIPQELNQKGLASSVMLFELTEEAFVVGQ